jgi:hypothetical protein
MTGIILQTRAIKIENRGPCLVSKEINLGNGWHKNLPPEKHTGTDYIVFNCPKCGRRNKQSMYDSKGAAGDSVSFKCKMCRIEVEVARPVPAHLIVSSNAPTQKSGLVDAAGRSL